MTEAMPFLQKYDITFLRPPTITEGVSLYHTFSDTPSASYKRCFCFVLAPGTAPPQYFCFPFPAECRKAAPPSRPAQQKLPRRGRAFGRITDYFLRARTAMPRAETAMRATAAATTSLAPVVGFFSGSVLGVSSVGVMMTMVDAFSSLPLPVGSRVSFSSVVVFHTITSVSFTSIPLVFLMVEPSGRAV